MPFPTQGDLFEWSEQHPDTAATECSQRSAADTIVPAIDLSPETELVFAVIAKHLGADSAITAPEIAESAGLWPEMKPANRGTKVRKLLEQSQASWPFPICGDSEGYYVAITADELSHYCANLRSRALCCLTRFASIRNAGRRAGFEYAGKGRWFPKPT